MNAGLRIYVASVTVSLSVTLYVPSTIILRSDWQIDSVRKAETQAMRVLPPDRARAEH